MALTVVLVRILNPDGDSSTRTVIIASAYYDEEESDSAGKKFSGSLLNALIFVLCIAAMTFILVLLFKYGCVNCIYCYMGFAVINIFFFMMGAMVIELFQRANIHMDAVSLAFILYNFSIVGMLGLFFWPAPLFMKQGYLVVIGVLVAYIFTLIPEWTTWVLLVFMALYDLAAVLAPGGPLKVLVELAIERQQDIPALVYEARPVRGAERGWGHYRRRSREETTAVTLSSGPVLSIGPVGEGLEDNSQGSSEVGAGEPQGADEDPVTPLVGASAATSCASSTGSNHRNHRSRTGSRDSRSRHEGSDVERGSQSAAAHSVQPPVQAPPAARRGGDGSDDEAAFELPDSLKLGLGDFIFYSVLVGRAAFYDFMTVYAAYLAIVAGLGMTLLLLAVARRALPALPFSIVLGVAFYFLARLVLEPVIVPLSLQLSLF
ncbi:unnamed protein product [Ostreobium quekettii]|uniref:Presenilin n=1 Tax=Ostreobium quekettii TaxID=121088 RepID=A0A8S1IMZ2_9CHLO|nr:unnamed protein product [Ostreobium quekettii]